MYSFLSVFQLPDGLLCIEICLKKLHVCLILRASSTSWTPKQRTCLTCETLTSWWARMTSQRSATSTSQPCCTISKSASSTLSSFTLTAVGSASLTCHNLYMMKPRMDSAAQMCDLQQKRPHLPFCSFISRLIGLLSMYYIVIDLYNNE